MRALFFDGAALHCVEAPLVINEISVVGSRWPVPTGCGPRRPARGAKGAALQRVAPL
jgi:hypothetical protein